MAGGGEHVVQAMAVRRGVMHVVGGDDSQANCFGYRQQSGDQPVVVGQPVALQLDPQPVAAEDLRQLARRAHGLRRIVGQHRLGHRALPAARQAEQPAGMLRHVFDGQQRRAFRAGQLADGDQPAEVGVAGLRLGQQRQV